MIYEKTNYKHPEEEAEETNEKEKVENENNAATREEKKISF